MDEARASPLEYLPGRAAGSPPSSAELSASHVQTHGLATRRASIEYDSPQDGPCCMVIMAGLHLVYPAVGMHFPGVHYKSTTM